MKKRSTKKSNVILCTEHRTWAEITTLTGRKILIMDWKFELKANVTLFGSYETGIVIGRAEYKSGNRQYLVRYKAGDGRLVEQWWDEDALDHNDVVTEVTQ